MSTPSDYLMFIDDDRPTNRYHEIILEDAPVSQPGKFFNSPVDALTYFEQLAHSSQPDLPRCIFLDINMPRYNGFELLDRLLKLPFRKFPPVFMLSTSDDPSDLKRAKQYKVIKHFFQKPLTPEALELAIGR